MVLRVHADVPPRIVLDAGPVIGAFNEQDRHHLESSHGLSRLALANARVLVPVPVVFEVYKWLAYHVRPAAARAALTSMRLSFEIIEVDRGMVDELADLVESIPTWAGSLEDALLGFLGQQLNAPVWTFNYRDLQAFRNLQFWTPA